MTDAQTYEPAEGNLGKLSDDEYFDDLINHPVTILDADGIPITGIYDDVVDERDKKGTE